MPRLSLDDAQDLVRRALLNSGASPAAAAATARALAHAEADGMITHGLARAPAYAAQARAGKVKGEAVPTLERLKPALVRIDAGHGFAYPAIDLALEALPEIARAQGVAAAIIARSHHFGQAGAHCEALAEQGLCALMFGNAYRSMAPWGGSRPLLGTNPIAFAAPMPEGPPLVIDMAMSKVARGNVILAAKKDEPIPEGWALDAEGRPTTNAKAALAGTMIPMGDAKGAALALMVEVLSAALVGSTPSARASAVTDAEGPPPDIGQTIIAIDAQTASGGLFAARMAEIAGLYAADGARLPGTRRLEARARAARDGLEVPSALYEELSALAAGRA